MVKVGLYEKLKKEYPVIARHVKAFPDAVQVRAFESMYDALLKDSGLASTIGPKPADTASIAGKDFSDIAELLSDGTIELTVRDPKASTLEDAVRRIVYLAIRANEFLTGNKSSNRKKVVLRALKKYRLNSGSAYNALSRVAGLIKVGDEWSLDGPAKLEADKYIKEARDDSIEGQFKPGSISRPKRKGTNKQQKQK